MFLPDLQRYNEQPQKYHRCTEPENLAKPGSQPGLPAKPADHEVLAHQYDLVCNGYELSSGAIRNHMPEYLYKVFNKVGYSKEMIDKNSWLVESSQF